MKKIMMLSVALAVVATFLCGWIIGQRAGVAYGLSGQVYLPVAWLHSVKAGDTDKALRRMEESMDMNALIAVNYRKKLWMLPKAQANLDKAILKVADYRQQYPRELTEPLFMHIYPNTPYQTTNELYEHFKKESDLFWQTVEKIRRDRNGKDSN